MQKVRVYQLAKELKVQSALILELLDRMGKEVKSDLSTLPSEIADEVRQRVTSAIAVERDCARMEWSVLDWNTPAHGFYRALGARPMDEWTTWRLTDAPLAALAGSGDERG